MQELFSQATCNWFADKIGTPTPVQVQGWPRIGAGENVLISAPTGTGKTLTAFLTFIDRMKSMQAKGTLEDKLYVIYLSPLKALGNDIRENLKRPNEGIGGAQLRCAVRTGDTTPYERQKMLRKPPHILITTPESLFLLLTSPRSRGMLKSAKVVIIDELHALIGSKRGAHMMLSLARLDDLCGAPLQRIGLSATIKPLEDAAEFLAYPAPCAIVAPDTKKDSDILVTSPVPDLRLISGTVWNDLAAQVYNQCENAHTVIAFMEARQQAERLAHGVNQLAGEGYARTHHGCVSKEQRLEAEMQLRSGELRLLCATSSMELGIDVGDVDLVLQVGCPMTVSGALQRLGRAGHQPGVTSVMRIFAKTAADALYCGLTATAAMQGAIEPAKPALNCLDVLSQHLVSMAVARDYQVDEALAIIKGCFSFKDVTRGDVCDCLAMLAGDWEHAQDRPVRTRVLYDRVNGKVMGDNYSRMLAVSAGGTIPDRGWYSVVLADGTTLGQLDEEYVFEARVGNKFLLGAFAWRIVEIKRDRVVVVQASPEGALPPFWKGDNQGRAFSVGVLFGSMLQKIEQAAGNRKLLQELTALHMDGDAAANAARHVRAQLKATGCLPTHKRIICEHFTDQAGDHQMMVHSVFGRRVNYGLALLCQHIAQTLTGLDVRMFEDDDGFLIYIVGDTDVPDGLLSRLRADSAVQAITTMLPSTPLFAMLFRYAASCALMMGVRGGQRQPLWVQRMRGQEQLSALVKEQNHPLIRETMRALTQDYLDFDALAQVISGIESGGISVLEMHLETPSPMALPMRRAAEMVLMYESDNVPSKAVKMVQQSLDQQAGIVPAQGVLDSQFVRRLPQNAQLLHALLMTEGDIEAGEIDVPIDWLTQLADAGRALYIDPGLWIAAEMEELYRNALVDLQEDALCRIVRLSLRYRGGQDAPALCDRYLLPHSAAQSTLEMLAAQGHATENNGVYYHEQVYARAQQDTLRRMRSDVMTQPPQRLASLISQQMRTSGTPKEQVRGALSRLCGQYYPLKTWEGVLLPSRVGGYQSRHLDDVLSEGAFMWRMQGDKIAFFPTEDTDWDAAFEDEDGLDEHEGTLLNALRRRGASFASSLSPLLPGLSALDALLALSHKGLVHADSLTPLRVEEDVLIAGRVEGKRLAHARASAMSSGRWAAVRPLKALTAQELTLRAFDACPLLCRETITNLSWAEAVNVLRVWEYTGRVRRGYFVSGLSGMQFVLTKSYDRVRQILDMPQSPAIWLSAADPMQPYGRFIAHAPGCDFMRVPGTAVCLLDGRAVAVVERQGETLRVFDDAHMGLALSALVRDHAQRRVFPDRDRLTIKNHPEKAAQALEQAGFTRVMLDYTVFR